jgi:signal recognition particle subunit SRP54
MKGGGLMKMMKKMGGMKGLGGMMPPGMK